MSESEEFNRLKRVVEACELGEIVEVQTRKDAVLVKLKIDLGKNKSVERETPHFTL